MRMRAALVRAAVLGAAVAVPMAPAAAFAAAPMAGCSAGGGNCYPPPTQPSTTTSATEVTVGEPVTICASAYAANAAVRLTDNKRPVTTITTDSTGHGCATVAWSSPNATARPVSGTSSSGAGGGAGRTCHVMANTGPDANGTTTTTSVTVCVSGRNGSVQTQVEGLSVTRGSLPFTGADIAAAVAVALALLAAGAVFVRAARRRSAG